MPGLPGAQDLEFLGGALLELKLDPAVAAKAFKAYVATWSKKATLSPRLMVKHLAAVQQILSGEMEVPDFVSPTNAPTVASTNETYDEILERQRTGFADDLRKNGPVDVDELLRDLKAKVAR